MPRVIAGSAKGRPLKAPPGEQTRPTSDRVKEALFSSLGALDGLVVADLYAGSGGLAIEALSRGATRAVLVEQDRRAVAVIRANLAAAGVAARAQVISSTVQAFADHPVGGPFDVVLVDPPYRISADAIDRALTSLVTAEALAEGAVVVIERASRTPDPPSQVLVHRRDRTYGETLLRYHTYLRGGQPTSQGAPTP